MVNFIWSFLSYTWFAWLALLLWPLSYNVWIGWRNKVFEHGLKWSFLEVLLPREVLTSPKAMESVLTQLHSLKNYPGDLREYWWLGEVTIWYSLEIAAFDGEVHLYVRCFKDYRDLVEAAFFAYYPDIEIVETEDYMRRWPASVQKLYENGYRMWGSEVVLEKSAAYPLRNYEDFESPDEEKQYDPMSGILETLSKLKPGQFAAIQFLVWPAMAGDPHDKHAFEEYEKEVIRVRERKDEEPPGAAKLKIKFRGGVLPTLEEDKPEEEAGVTRSLKRAIMTRTPGETDVLTAMQDSLARPMYSVLIRYIYVSPFETYSEHFPRRAVFGALNQYGAVDINAFTRNKPTMTRGKVWEWPFIFPDIRKEYRRQRIWYTFRHREPPPHMFMGKILTSYFLNWYLHSKSVHLSTRSLATIWHPPTHRVLTGPHIRRIESKKMAPPAGMEIFGEDKDIEKFS